MYKYEHDENDDVMLIQHDEIDEILYFDDLMLNDDIDEIRCADIDDDDDEHHEIEIVDDLRMKTLHVHQFDFLHDEEDELDEIDVMLYIGEHVLQHTNDFDDQVYADIDDEVEVDENIDVLDIDVQDIIIENDVIDDEIDDM